MTRVTSLAAAAAVVAYAGLAFAQQSTYSPMWPNRNGAQPAFGSATAPSDRQTATPWQRQSTIGRETMTNSPGQFASESDAKARCGSDTVVWVNTKSHVYHFGGSKDYGHTKRGAFMCRADADRTAFRAAKNEMKSQGNTERTAPSRFGSSVNRGY